MSANSLRIARASKIRYRWNISYQVSIVERESVISFGTERRDRNRSICPIVVRYIFEKECLEEELEYNQKFVQAKLRYRSLPDQRIDILDLVSHRFVLSTPGQRDARRLLIACQYFRNQSAANTQLYKTVTVPKIWESRWFFFFFFFCLDDIPITPRVYLSYLPEFSRKILK